MNGVIDMTKEQKSVPAFIEAILRLSQRQNALDHALQVITVWEEVTGGIRMSGPAGIE